MCPWTFCRCCSGQPLVAKRQSRSTSFQLLRGLALYLLRSLFRRSSSIDSFRRKICFLDFVFFLAVIVAWGRRQFWNHGCSFGLFWPLSPVLAAWPTVFPGTIRETSSAFVGEGLTVCFCISWLLLFSFSKQFFFYFSLISLCICVFSLVEGIG